FAVRGRFDAEAALQLRGGERRPVGIGGRDRGDDRRVAEAVRTQLRPDARRPVTLRGARTRDADAEAIVALVAAVAKAADRARDVVLRVALLRELRLELARRMLAAAEQAESLVERVARSGLVAGLAHARVAAGCASRQCLGGRAAIRLAICGARSSAENPADFTAARIASASRPPARDASASAQTFAGRSGVSSKSSTGF